MEKLKSDDSYASINASIQMFLKLTIFEQDLLSEDYL